MSSRAGSLLEALKKTRREGRIRQGEVNLPAAFSVGYPGTWPERGDREPTWEKFFHDARALCCGLNGVG